MEDFNQFFGIVLVIGSILFFVLFILWAYQQYQIQQDAIQTERESLQRTESALQQIQQPITENFETMATSVPGSPIQYSSPDVQMSMKFGEKPDIAIDVQAKKVNIQKPPTCNNVSAQYIYNLNQKIMEQNKLAEEVNKRAAQANAKSRST